MLYNIKKKKQHLLALRKQVNQPYIGVIETTMMYHSLDQSNDHSISVFTLFVEEPSRHLILIRFYEDFQEFDKRIKLYSKKCKITLPKLLKEEEHTHISTPRKQRHNSISSINSSHCSVHSNESNHSSTHSSHSNNININSSNGHNNKRNSSFRKILHSFSHKSSQKKSNSDNIERYLRHCMNDLIIQKCSLFKEFLQPQREEDNVILKQVVQSYVQQESSLNVDVDHATPLLHTRENIRNKSASVAAISSPITPPPDTNNTNKNDDTAEGDEAHDVSTIQSSFSPCNSFASQQQLDQPQIIENRHPITTSSIISSSMSSSEKPVTIQDFQLIKVIGRGCMGKVLLVRHRNSSRLLALKAISKKAVVEQSQIVHIKAEQQILSDIASIHHPFLIKLHYSFQDMNQLFLVLDYHVGGDLATQLRINHMLPPERCRFYTAEIILGIQELHRLGILYRDLKPENILLTADGHLVLTDFGLSKQFYDGLSLDEQRTDTFCGTAEYLAPEILNGQPYSYEVDYWSMGTILFEMLCGITPFWAENRDDMYRRIRGDPLQFPEFIDIETADFIARLLKRDPKRRLGSGPDGAIRVRSDPYFEFIDWNHIYQKRIRPPYIPNLYSDTDFSHFDSEFLRLTPRLSPVGSDYILSQSLDRAFEGYSYTNREETLLDSPPSELYSLNEPPPPITLMDTNNSGAGTIFGGGAGGGLINNSSSDVMGQQQRTRYFVYNGSDDVMPYDEYADDSNISSNDDIRSSDFVRSNSYQRRFSDEDEDDFDYYRQLPPRPTITRRNLNVSINNINNGDNIEDEEEEDEEVTPTNAANVY